MVRYEADSNYVIRERPNTISTIRVGKFEAIEITIPKIDEITDIYVQYYYNGGMIENHIDEYTVSRHHYTIRWGIPDRYINRICEVNFRLIIHTKNPITEVHTNKRKIKVVPKTILDRIKYKKKKEDIIYGSNGKESINNKTHR